MKIVEYSANGNTFLIFDSMTNLLGDDTKRDLILNYITDQDGAIFVEKSGQDFFMDYFNRDGKRAIFCGNGARAFVAFLRDEGFLKDDHLIFHTKSGTLKGFIQKEKISVQMPGPIYLGKRVVEEFEGHLIRVGVLHFVLKVKSVDRMDVIHEGKRLRALTDANIDFYQILEKNCVKMRTFEKGVERETKACGSGAAAVFSICQTDRLLVEVPGGILCVYINGDSIFLQGEVRRCKIILPR
ncbi:MULTISPECIES: diaminopimelate epimerase [Pseudothermotoga]|jgi:diaminopimelate epimerase|uniref:Diaminopimelate epimerase n=1 Tax=Pseudothermotoga lettingae (strain ATCC BAA-301 / DSM 14385 / NBRC 107922 / TMO) TaxID=416591 RepID=A8F8L9_PSELT|nr:MULTISPECIES: diaminopimelate epimerase [Pseudothermotoga]ABV34503.1 Diaminopimelate epimerase [Pseudothermotoga lettingae TMO]KUK21217.1 MAG: Diaminopimelate epimerase [Pseudothermotoga lettingae]MDI3494571.1 diaminopimelate epimerase [Pseudothermotoga sp.]MDK2883552.1 diaminopimelate epimerase [Pseudothermotoga sp.]GLI48551.1 diaminopimelate epimerase [Pseudothermotoga lettingae TMO]